MDLGFKDKVAIVTGSGAGIGRMIALILAEEGAHVVINDIDQVAAERVVNEVQAKGVKSLGFVGNVADQAFANEMVNGTLKEFGRVDILINNAGRGVNWEAGKKPRPFVEQDKDEWDYPVDLCLYGTMNCTRAVLPGMIERKYGKIVNCISDAGRIGEPFMSGYSAAKGGIIAWQKAIAKEVGRYNININGVSFGATLTERISKTREASKAADPEAFAKRQEAQLKIYPLRRFAEVEDSARPVVFMASEWARHITGQTLSASGGFSMVS
ncbi:MAG: SDR family oxidoreductase [Deltaproteobacteria bacterium]|nr:SDR family oxidoreductase [Deltaproteobacteria bacterium]